MRERSFDNENLHLSTHTLSPSHLPPSESVHRPRRPEPAQFNKEINYNAAHQRRSAATALPLIKFILSIVYFPFGFLFVILLSWLCAPSVGIAQNNDVVDIA
jgi:hypothetical protein